MTINQQYQTMRFQIVILLFYRLKVIRGKEYKSRIVIFKNDICKNISLTARDKYILTQLGEGRTIFEISALLNLHLKTIYQARQNLIKKLGCSGLIDFQGILRAQIFRNWLEHA
ncbi:LuxR C-terminal-related transcriptional regulator [Citrobacter freundii]|uniref:LuxR C-terminal-related transcriptional regulator n=1 Tax=Citrobacter freundii TaxID=546 RepID=UPI00350FDE77